MSAHSAQPFQPNRGQLQAIRAPLTQPVRVVAGAGTGKTEVVARRFVHLLEQDRGLRPENILVLTFSERAAAEMRARIFRAVTGSGLGFSRLDLAAASISTFHAFAARLLRDHSLRARLDPGQPVLSDVEIETLLDEARESFLEAGFAEAYSFDPLDQDAYEWHKTRPFDHALGVVAQLRNQAARVEDLASLAAGLSEAGRVLQPLVAWLYRAYHARLSALGRLDFDRMIADAAQLVAREPGLRARLRGQFRALLVDEYQDTNFAQDGLLRALAADSLENVTVVGDPRQAIYVWREARVENIAHFPGPGLPRFDAPLTENRRSLKPILDAANRAIAGYALGQPPEFSADDVLQPFDDHRTFTGTVVNLHALPDREAEAAAIVGWIRQARAEGYAFGDMAVLVRARTYLAAYTDALRAAGIPFELSAGDAFYIRPEILDAVHLLTVCLNPADELSLARVLLSPMVGLSQAQAANLKRDRRQALWSAVRAAAAEGDEALARLARLYDEAQAQRWRLSPAAFVAWALERGGLAAAHDPAARRALAKLVAIAHGYEAEHPAEGLSGLAEHLRLLLDGDPRAKAPELNAEADAVRVLTAHASKGLEFEVVIAADCRQKIAPGRDLAPFHEPAAGLIFPKDDEQHPGFLNRVRRARNEARCLWYVTLTRAKRRLIITAANGEPLEDGRYPEVKTFFEELWNAEAAEPTPGVALGVGPEADLSAPGQGAAAPPAAQPGLGLAEQLRLRLAALAEGRLKIAAWPPAWDEAFEFAAPECGPLLRACQAAGAPPPAVGYELADGGRVIAAAELAWPAQRVAVFVQAAGRAAFEQAGWRTFMLEESKQIVQALQ